MPEVENEGKQPFLQIHLNSCFWKTKKSRGVKNTKKITTSEQNKETIKKIRREIASDQKLLIDKVIKSAWKKKKTVTALS